MRREGIVERTTFTGLVAFAIGLLQFGSGFSWGRVSIGSLSLLPYLLVLVPAVPIVASTRVLLDLQPLLRSTAAFVGAFALSYLVGGGGLAEVVKLATFMLTLVTVALLVKTRRDFALGALGLILGVALLANRGLAEVEGNVRLGVGVNPFEGIASKNLYSMYALPAVFMASALVLGGHVKGWRRWGAMALGAAIALALLGSANRSGWAGLLVVPPLLAGSRKNIRLALFVVVVGSAAYLGLQHFELMEVVEQRVELTRAGYSADDLRREMYLATVPIFLSNPLVGTLLPKLDFVLGEAIMGTPEMPIGPHSVLILLVAGGGLVVLVPFVFFGRSLWRLRLGGRVLSQAQYSAQWMLRRLILLWLVRGLFSDEVLYAPAFAVAAGLLVGLGRVELRESLFASGGAAASAGGARRWAGAPSGQGASAPTLGRRPAAVTS